MHLRVVKRRILTGRRFPGWYMMCLSIAGGTTTRAGGIPFKNNHLRSRVPGWHFAPIRGYHVPFELASVAPRRLERGIMAETLDILNGVSPQGRRVVLLSHPPLSEHRRSLPARHMQTGDSLLSTRQTPARLFAPWPSVLSHMPSLPRASFGLSGHAGRSDGRLTGAAGAGFPLIFLAPGGYKHAYGLLRTSHGMDERIKDNTCTISGSRSITG